MEEELNEFIARFEECISKYCPKWITPNSNFVAIEPGHNLDLLKISFDFRVNRMEFLTRDTPQFLKDISKADLSIIKGG